METKVALGLEVRTEAARPKAWQAQTDPKSPTKMRRHASFKRAVGKKRWVPEGALKRGGPGTTWNAAGR